MIYSALYTHTYISQNVLLFFIILKESFLTILEQGKEEQLLSVQTLLGISESDDDKVEKEKLKSKSLKKTKHGCRQ